MSKSNKPRTNKNIYVDIDALFDTKLATLYLISPGDFNKLTDTKEYYFRHKDVFGLVGHDTFDSMYRTRTKELLQFALPTKLLPIVIERYGELITDIVNLDIRNDICIYVNLYPYELNEEEKENLKDGLTKRIGGEVPIEFINFSNYDLTAKWIKEHVSTIYKYDAAEWLNIQLCKLDLITNPLVDTLIFAPAIASHMLPNKDINKKYFESIMDMFKPITNMVLLDPEYFSQPIK